MAPDALQKGTRKFAWYFFGIVSLSYLMVYFHRVAPAVVSDLLMAELSLSGAVLGNLAAIYFYVYTVMQLPAGVLADGVGAKKTIFWGMIISGIGSLIFAASSILVFACFGRIEASSNLLIIAVGLLIRCPTVGYISDRIGKRKLPLLISSLMYVLSWVAMLIWPGGKTAPSVLPFLLFAMGFFASGFILLWACAKEVIPIELSGCSIGLANMGGFLGAAIVQPLFGWALDSRWLGHVEEGVRIYPLEAWRFAFLLALVILLSTTLIGILIKEPNQKTVKSRRQIRQYEVTQAYDFF